MWKWKDGRQDSGYKVFFLWNYIFDLILIRYPVGSHSPQHYDKVIYGYEHHRINIVLRNAKRGGKFWVINTVLLPMFLNRRVLKFRPDKIHHGVSPILEGERWVLSIGWVRKSGRLTY